MVLVKVTAKDLALDGEICSKWQNFPKTVIDFTVFCTDYYENPTFNWL